MDWKTEHRIRTGGPWIVFAATILISWLLYSHGNQPGQAMGFAEGEEIAIGTTQTGRVISISVEPGQEVKAGQIMAKLDASTIDAEIAILEAELEESRIGGQSTLLKDTEALDSEVQRAQLAVAREKTGLKSAQAELEVLTAERTRLRELVTKNLATGEDLASLDLRYATLVREVSERPITLKLLQEQLRKVRSRADTREQTEKDPLVQAIQSSVDVKVKRLDFLKLQREALMLRAPVAGTVTAIHGLVGEVVTPGEPVVGLVGLQSSRVIACLSEDDALSIERGHQASLWVRGRETQKLTGHVVSLGPLVDEVPLRCRQAAGRPAWGRHVTIQLDNQQTLIPGQSLGVKFDLSIKRGTAQAHMLKGPTAGDLVKLQVPDDLMRLSRFEPSGLVWSPQNARYLLVSDDTGLKGKHEHSPWLFSMSSKGALDPQPIPIKNAGQLKDLESITADSNGDLYLLSSQSHSRKGKRSSERTQFLKVRSEANQYSLIASQSLAEALDRAPKVFLESLQLQNGTKDLEIEAMTYWNNELYLGLKSPLSQTGHAIIWKFRNPDAFLRNGNISDAGLQHWASVQLPARIDGRNVPAGISELLFLPNGSLLITSTPSTADNGVSSGAISYSHQPSPGIFQTLTLKEFPGRKPEGLSLSAKPGHIVVTFDKGADTPEWVELPWPQ